MADNHWKSTPLRRSDVVLERHRRRLFVAALFVSSSVSAITIGNFFILGFSNKLLAWAAVTCGLSFLFARFLHNRARARDAHLFAIFVPAWQEAGTPGDYICVFVSMFIVVGSALAPHSWQS